VKKLLLINSFALIVSFCFALSASYCASHCEEVSIVPKTCDGNQTTVTISLEEKRELIPDTLLLKFRVSVTTTKETEALNLMGELDEALRKLNLEYKGGKYSVRENCWWEKGERKCVGYKGSITYSFLLKNYSEQNEVFKVIDKFKRERGEKVKFEVNEPEWIVSEKRRKETERELTALIFERAKSFSKTASKALDKVCDVEAISYEKGYPIYYPNQVYAFGAAEGEAIKAPQPEKEEKSVSVRAKVRLRCK